MSFVPNTEAQRAEMLAALGKSMEDLFSGIPPELRARAFDLPPGRSELEVRQALGKLAAKNHYQLVSFLGGGFYDHFIPAAVDSILSRGEFFSAYTPYQPEASQGTLQAIYEFQTAVARLTGMEAANASLYDGGTALYEATMMALRVTGRRKVILDEAVNPIYRKMLRSYTTNLEIEFREFPSRDGRSDRGRIAEQPRRQDRRRHRAEPDLLRLRGRLLRHRADGAQGRGAADRLVLSALARHPQDARRDGRRHRDRRGPEPGAAALVRRAVSRAPVHAPPLRAQDARTPGRADGGPEGPAGLRADAPGARAARAPGQGHQQHLHERIALRAGRARLPDAARQGRPDGGGATVRGQGRVRAPAAPARSPASRRGSPRRSSTNSSWTCRCRRCT